MSTYSDQEDHVIYTFVELLESCQMQDSFVMACVEHGVLEPHGNAPEQWRFTLDMRNQLQRAWRLHHDLDVQPQTLPLILDLLAEVEALRSEVQFLRQRLRHWEPD